MNSKNKENKARGLESIRLDINEVDTKLKELFIKRSNLAKEVYLAKKETNDPIHKPDREQQVIANITKDVEESLVSPMTAFFKNTMFLGRNIQYGLKHKDNPTLLTVDDFKVIKSPIYYQGVVGSYSYFATKKVFETDDITNLKTFKEVFISVNENDGFGVIPYENSTAGYVDEVFDLLVKYDLYINMVVDIDVIHCLAGVKGSNLSEIKTVISHPQALSQCSKFIENNKLNQTAYSNTALAAKFVMENDNNSFGAICSKKAAEEFNLDVITDDINDEMANITRFLVVSKKLTKNNEREENTISVMLSIPHRAGALTDCLAIFSSYDTNLVKIHSRPKPNSPWEFMFFIEFMGDINSEKIKSLLFRLKEENLLVKILGCF